MLSQLLTVCAGYGWVLKTTIVSFALFGEYPFPEEEEEEEN